MISSNAKEETLSSLPAVALTPTKNKDNINATISSSSKTHHRTPHRSSASKNNTSDDPTGAAVLSLQTLSSSTKKSKLSAVMGDGSFESIMKQRATKRREKDEQCIAELRYSISSMDLNLTQEIKRRIESVTKLENDCQKNIQDMEKRLNDAMDEKFRCIEFMMKSMEEKVQELNGRLEVERNKIPKDIETKGRELKEMIHSFQDEFNTERRERLGREGSIMKQLTDHAQEMKGRWQEENQTREQCVNELRSRLEEHESNRAQADEGFESLIARELEA